ncbi:MAG: DUF1571 domain-containing protein [Pirellulaceae bacterium]|jgi:hypothetical protein|nr:DUF1571 domain-containing protein [Pirellulaceae bacterium]MDP7020221.1 DUF1571 domain-containing protein [Pirellulaceae bacterium]
MTQYDQNYILGRRNFLRAASLGLTVPMASWALAQQREPVFRVAKKVEPGNQGTHPLDPALKVAREKLAYSQKNIVDYQCTLIKRERINGKVGNYEYMATKIRNRKVQGGRVVTPLSAYMYFLKPDDVKGREVLYVEGQNNGKLIAKEGGIKGRLIPTVWLNPNGPIAMRGQLYPITEIGVENLMVKLIERGARERKFPECDVKFYANFKVNKRVCTKIEVMHPKKEKHFDFYMAQIFIDDQLNVPIRYAAYDWPRAQGARPEVIEEYTYLQLQLNVGLKDDVFDYKNPAYKFT